MPEKAWKTPKRTMSGRSRGAAHRAPMAASNSPKDAYFYLTAIRRKSQ